MLNIVWQIQKDGPQDTHRLFKGLKRLDTIILEIKCIGEGSTDEVSGKNSNEAGLTKLRYAGRFLCLARHDRSSRVF